MTAVLPHAAAAEGLRQLPNTLKTYAGFAEIVGALASGRPAAIDGVWGSACALVASALASESRGPLVIILPSQREAEDTAVDIELFAGREPEFFPAGDGEPGERVVDDETFGQRLRVLKSLLTPVTSGTDQGRDEAGEGVRKNGVTAAPRGTGLARFIKKKPAASQAEPEEDQTLTPALSQGESELSLALRPVLVTSIQALLQPSPRREAIRAATRVLKKGERVEVEELLRWLVERGFHATGAVELPGEFSHRGGIIDIFATDWLLPVRIELFDDEIESLRSFEVATQRSQETLEEIEITVLSSGAGEAGHLTDYLPPNSWMLLVDPQRINDEGKSFLLRHDKPTEFHSLPAVLAEVGRFAVATTAEIQADMAGVHCHLPFESVERFSGDIARVRDELDTIAHGDEVFIVSPTEAEVERLREILSSTKLAGAGRLHYPIGTLQAGFD